MIARLKITGLQKQLVMQTNTFSLDLSSNMIVYVICDNKKANILHYAWGQDIKVMVELKKKENVQTDAWGSGTGSRRKAAMQSMSQVEGADHTFPRLTIAGLWGPRGSKRMYWVQRAWSEPGSAW